MVNSIWLVDSAGNAYQWLHCKSSFQCRRMQRQPDRDAFGLTPIGDYTLKPDGFLAN
jgi:hypothetical protein